MTNDSSRQWLFWLAVGGLFLLFLYLIRGILLPFVVGGLAAYFLDPAANKLAAKGLSRSMATAVIISGFFLILLTLCVWIPPLLIDQLSDLLEALPQYAAAFHERYTPRISAWLGGLPGAHMEDIKQAATSISGALATGAADFAAGLFSSVTAILNILSLLLITPVVAFYLLRDWDDITTRADRLLPKKQAPVIREQLIIIDRTLAGFVRGQLNVCLILAVYYAIGLSLTGLKFGVVIGALTGLLVILPYVGFLFGFLLGMGVAFFQFDAYLPIALVLAVYMIGQALESYILTPNLVGGKVGLHPVWIIFGMLAGAALFGFVGILLAIPVTAIIGVLIRFALARYLESEYYGAARGKK